jgi:EAL domain-containing protein (putative c-di-GMP-specific phosphodiesterase class I)
MTAERVVGVEALIRWRHPERGLLAPAEFLYAVAGSELEIPLGEWVIGNAIKQVAAWKSQGLSLPISINLVARHLQHPAFTERLAAALAFYPTVSGKDLEIEILESSALSDIDQASNLIKACQAIGVRIALDDFGAGYSSLSYFKHLPVDVLKIDQTFVRDMQDDPEDMAIVEGVIKLAQAFGREVIAEGVENIEQGSLLIHLGCRLAQGYAIARPMPADNLLNWITHWQCDPGWKMMAGLSLAREDLVLVVAESSHQQWVGQLIAYLEADPVDSQPPSNGETCRFGHWLAGQGRTQYQHLPEFGEIEALHKSIHALAEEIVKQHAEDAAGARDRIGDIKLLRDRVVTKISELIAAVLTSTMK